MHDQAMSDVSDPLLTCDADVVGSDATLINNSMHVDVTGANTHSPHCSSSPASALRGFLSMTEYTSKPVLIDIAKPCETLQCATYLEMLRTSCCIPTVLNVLNLKLMRACNFFLKACHVMSVSIT